VQDQDCAPRNWTTYTTFLKVNCYAEVVGFGVGLLDAGTVWIDDVSAEVEDEEATPGQVGQPLPGTENLDFEL